MSYSVTEAMKHRSKPSDLVQGTLDMLLLKILALEPMNGFAVSQRLKQVSGDVLQMSDGSLYPARHKLEQEGWITAEWKTSVNGRRAKYYSLTRLGRRQLAGLTGIGKQDVKRHVWLPMATDGRSEKIVMTGPANRSTSTISSAY